VRIVTDDLKEMLIPAAISVPFFIFGFATAANLLDLTLNDVVIGAFAGGVFGVTCLLTAIFRSGDTNQPSLPA
jgi:hypothetical protein